MVAEHQGFMQKAEGDAPEVSSFWSETGSYVDFTSPAGYEWWRDQVRDELLAKGIDATWNDNNEYEIWDDAAHCAGFGAEMPIGLVRPALTLLMLRASRDAQADSVAWTLRPYLISRSGSPGAQRYAQTWSGDNESSWHTLRWNLPMGLGLSLSGWPNTGHDVGGFVGAKPDPELLVRWVQCGVFFPRFTIHSWQFDNSATEPWMYPEVLPIVRDAMRLRYRLLPYLYASSSSRPARATQLCDRSSMTSPATCAATSTARSSCSAPTCLSRRFWNRGHGAAMCTYPLDATGTTSGRGPCTRAARWCSADAPLERIPLFVPEGGIAADG